jgi:hypothetical protein
MWHARGQ